MGKVFLRYENGDGSWLSSLAKRNYYSIKKKKGTYPVGLASFRIVSRQAVTFQEIYFIKRLV